MQRMDGILASTLAGMAATLLKDIPNFILFQLGLIKTIYWFMAASVFMLPKDSITPIGLTIGGVADIILGGTLGIVIFSLFKCFGYDWWWYKGLCAGNIIWLFGSGIAVNLFSRIVPVDPISGLHHCLNTRCMESAPPFLIWWWTKPVKMNRN